MRLIFVEAVMRAMIAVAVLLAGSCGIDTDGGVNPRHLKYPSCEAAKKDGADLPLTPDKPGWNPKLDRDKDGKAC